MWTKYQPIENTLLDAERMGLELQSDMDRVNGHLTGHELPDASIGPSQLVTGGGTFIQYGATNYRAPIIQDVPSVGLQGGFEIDQVEPSWMDANGGTTITIPDGILQLNADLLFWIEKTRETTDRVTYIEARILYDGVAVAQSGKVYKPAGNILLQATIPTSAGTHQFKVQVFVQTVTDLTGSPLVDTDAAGYWRGNVSYLLRQR